MEKKIVIVAGEQSGELLGAKLIRALRDNSEMTYKFAGVGGEKMLSLGFKSIFPLQGLSVMGFSEIIGSIPRILMRLLQTVSFIKKYEPDLIITIDSPSFNFRLMKKLRKMGIKTPAVHYVAPTVWAYAPERAKLVAELYDHILLLLPFEKPYFDIYSIEATFVGHPALEDNTFPVNKQSAKTQSGFDEMDKIVTIMPGSRETELRSHLPILSKVIEGLWERHESLTVILPTLPHLVTILESYFFGLAQSQRSRIIIETRDEIKKRLMYVSDLAIVKSGTSTLELMKLKVPMIVGYKVSPLSAWLLRRKLKIKYVNIGNLIMGRGIIPELLQENFTPEKILEAAEQLLNDKKKRTKQLEAYDIALEALWQIKTKTPSEQVAEIIINMLSSH